MTDRVPSYSSQDLIRALHKLGFHEKSGGKGSHTKLIHPQLRGSLTIPSNRNLGKGLRVVLIKQIELMGIERKRLLDIL